MNLRPPEAHAWRPSPSCVQGSRATDHREALPERRATATTQGHYISGGASSGAASGRRPDLLPHAVVRDRSSMPSRPLTGWPSRATETSTHTTSRAIAKVGQIALRRLARRQCQRQQHHHGRSVPLQDRRRNGSIETHAPADPRLSAMSKPLHAAGALVLLTALVGPAARAEEAVASSLPISRIAGPIAIDGDLSDAGWREATPIMKRGSRSIPATTGLSASRPSVPGLRRSVRLRGLQFDDPEPSKIRAPLGDRDNLSSVHRLRRRDPRHA